MSHPAIRLLTPAPDDVALGAALVREYVAATAEEMAAPGEHPDVEAILPYIPDYADFAAVFLAPRSAFLVAEDGGEPTACVGVRAYDEHTAELNRLWVRPPHQRRGLGRTLTEAAMDHARALGYRRMILDVLAIRTRAIALYRSLGFTDVDPLHEYTFDVVALGRDL